MFTLSKAARLGAILLLAAACSASWAQRTINRCVVGGQVVLSDRPCPTAEPGRLGAIGPQQPARMAAPAPAYQPRAPRAPEHLQYLSPECAEISEAIRTAPSRGVRYEVVSELRTEYRRKCSEDESLAQMQRHLDERRQRQDRLAARQVAQSEKVAHERQREQCVQLQELLQSRRQRLATMNDSERAALAQSQANYDARCLGR